MSGQVFNFLYISGNIPNFVQFLEMIERDLRDDISCRPCFLLLSRDCDIFIFSSLKVIEVILALMTYELVSVSVLSFESGSH